MGAKFKNWSSPHHMPFLLLLPRCWVQSNQDGKHLNIYDMWHYFDWYISNCWPIGTEESFPAKIQLLVGIIPKLNWIVRTEVNRNWISNQSSQHLVSHLTLAGSVALKILVISLASVSAFWKNILDLMNPGAVTRSEILLCHLIPLPKPKGDTFSSLICSCRD